MLTTLIFIPALTAALAGTGPTVNVQTVGGEPAQGTLVQLDARHVALDTPKGRVTLDLDKVTGIAVKAAPPGEQPPPGVWIELVDGSTLSGTGFTAAQGKAKLALAGQPALEIPAQHVRWVRFQAPSEATARQWSQLVEGDLKTDLLVVKKGEAIDYHKGVLGDVTEDMVRFDLDGEVLPVKRAKVHGLVYHRVAGRELPAAACQIHEAGGATWAAQSIQAAEGRVEWTTPTGLKLSSPLAALARIDFSQGKVVYLSDLKPESTEWLPYFSIGKELPALAALFAPRSDRSLGGGPLQLEGQRYAKGLAIHSRTTLVYRLPDRYRRFLATVGIDDRVRPRGHVQLSIRGDDRELFRGAVAGSDPPKPLDLDLAGVRRLTIHVEFGDDLDVADHLDLCEARLIK